MKRVDSRSSVACRLAAVLLAGICLNPFAAQAQDASWLLSPGSNNFNTGANWTPAAVPTGTASFGASNTTSLTFSGPTTTVGTFQFNAGAPAYSFGFVNQVFFTGAGIVNNSSNGPTFSLTGLGQLFFQNASTAGNASITVANNMSFEDSSTAGNATIVNNGLILILSSSTAGNATIVNNGFLLFFESSTAGNATIVNNGVLNFNNSATAGNATVNTNSGGNTVFISTSTGGQARFVTNLGGTFDIGNLTSGGMAAGSIEGAGSHILGTKQLTVGGNNLSTSVSGVISGVGGSLVKVGAGTLTLTGANSYTGGTTLNAGTLSVNGSIASPVTVGAGSILGGTGVINGAVGILNGGIFAPGNSIGTITVNGNVSFAAGSIFRVEVDAAGNADRINVAGAPGTATLNGGTVDVQASAGTYQQNTRYTIINATGGVNGAFAAVTSNLAFLTPSLAYDANNAFLDLQRNDVAFSTVALTRNQRAVATTLQNSVAGASTDMNTVLSAVTGLSAPQARDAYDAISGVGLVELRRAAAGFAADFGQHLNRRLGLVAASESVLYAQAPSASSASGFSSRDGRGFWLRAHGAHQDTESDGNAAGSSLRGGGFTLGADAQMRDGLVLGVAASAGASRLDMDSSRGSGRSRGAAIGGYASHVAGPWSFKGTAGFAWNDNHMDRPVVIGALANTASADFDSHSASLYAEASYEMAMGSYTLRPIAALSHVRTSSDAFTERGAGVTNLQVDSQHTHTTRMLLGAKTMHEAGSLRIEPRLLWAHEFSSRNAPMRMRLSGAPAAGPFDIYGVDLARDSLILGLGVSGSVARRVSLFADTQLDRASRQRRIAAFVGVRASW